MEKKYTEQHLKDAITATMKGMVKWIESDKVICQDKTTKIKIPNSEIEATEKYSILNMFILPELNKVGIEYIVNNE